MGNNCSRSFQNVTIMLLANLFNNFHLLINPQKKVNFVLSSFNDDTVEQYVLPPSYSQNMKVEGLWTSKVLFCAWSCDFPDWYMYIKLFYFRLEENFKYLYLVIRLLCRKYVTFFFNCRKKIFIIIEIVFKIIVMKIVAFVTQRTTKWRIFWLFGGKLVVIKYSVTFLKKYVSKTWIIAL